MMPPTPNEVLDMRANIGTVSYRFEFDVLSTNLEPMGRVVAKAGSITNDSTATIKRALRGFTLKSDDAAHVNPYTDKIRVSMVTEDRKRWPLGVFMFTDDTVSEASSHRFYDATLVDQGLRLNQQIRWPFAIPKNGDLQQHFVKLVERAGLFEYDVSLPYTECGSDIGWPTGTLVLEILTQISVLAGATAPYFNNSGVLTARDPMPLSKDIAHTYHKGKHSRIVRNTRQTTKNLLTAPNVYVVESNETGRAPITATAWVDPAMPHSVERIGYERPSVRKMQGVRDTPHAQRIARSLAETDPLQLESSQFSSSPDPRHDTFEVVNADGELYRDKTWDLPLHVGMPMTHTVTKQVAPTQANVALS